MGVSSSSVIRDEGPDDHGYIVDVAAVEPESSVLGAQTVVVSALIVGCVLTFALNRLKRRRPELAVGLPLAVALGLRLLAAAGVSATGLESTLRGGDEDTYLNWATLLADSPIGQGFLPHDPYELHTVLFALEMKYGSFSEGAMRVGQVGIAMLGVLFLLAAVYDSAGPRAAIVTAMAARVRAGEPFLQQRAEQGADHGPRRRPRGLRRDEALAPTRPVRARRHRGRLPDSRHDPPIRGLVHDQRRGAPDPARRASAPRSPAQGHAAGLRRDSRRFSSGARPSSRRPPRRSSSDCRLPRTTPRAKVRQSSTGANSDNLALERVDFSTREAVLTQPPQAHGRRGDPPLPLAGRQSRASNWAPPEVSWPSATLLLLIVMFWEWRGRAMSRRRPVHVSAGLLTHGLFAQRRQRRHRVPLPDPPRDDRRRHARRAPRAPRATCIAAVRSPGPTSPFASHLTADGPHRRRLSDPS